MKRKCSQNKGDIVKLVLRKKIAIQDIQENNNIISHFNEQIKDKT